MRINDKRFDNVNFDPAVFGQYCLIEWKTVHVIDPKVAQVTLRHNLLRDQILKFFSHSKMLFLIIKLKSGSCQKVSLGLEPICLSFIFHKIKLGYELDELLGDKYFFLFFCTFNPQAIGILNLYNAALINYS